MWTGAENLASLGVPSPECPALASRCTNWAVLAHHHIPRITWNHVVTSHSLLHGIFKYIQFSQWCNVDTYRATWRHIVSCLVLILAYPYRCLNHIPQNLRTSEMSVQVYQTAWRHIPTIFYTVSLPGTLRCKVPGETRNYGSAFWCRNIAQCLSRQCWMLCGMYRTSGWTGCVIWLSLTGGAIP